MHVTNTRSNYLGGRVHVDAREQLVDELGRRARPCVWCVEEGRRKCM